MTYQWNPDEGFSRLDQLSKTDDPYIKAGSLLGIGILNAGTYNNEYQISFF